MKNNGFASMVCLLIKTWLSKFFEKFSYLRRGAHQAKLFLFLCVGLFPCSFGGSQKAVTPYKFTDEEMKRGGPVYEIPCSARFTTKREGKNAPEIVYYFSPPRTKHFPIAVLCGGSSLEDNVTSVIHVHRYFLKELLALGIGVVTVEQQGVDGKRINVREFMRHYTRSNRLSDHCFVIDHLTQHPPKGWNKKFIFIGVSEGGLIATTLTTSYPERTLATINWSGAGDFSWREELWIYMQDAIDNTPWTIKWRAALPLWMPYSLNLSFPTSRKAFDKVMDEALKNPSADLKFAGMTYLYHGDALTTYPPPAYEKIKTPYLVVAGAKDSSIESSDAFVRKAKKVGAPVTYMRISDMDHYVRKRDDVIKASFVWLKKKLSNHDPLEPVEK